MADVIHWKPNPKQAEFLNLDDNIFEGFFAGSAGPGKSEILTLYPIIREFYKVPTFKGLIMRKTFPELQSEIILRAHNYYPQTGARWIGDQKTYVWDAYNSRIRFGHLEHDQDKKKYDGTEYQYYAPDELTSFSEDEYTYIAMSRLRTTNRVRPIVRAASNPGGIGHEWVRDRFVAPAREGRVILRDKETGLLRIFIPARLEDNEFLLKTDPDYINKLKALPIAERKAKLDGDWWTFTGQVFSFRERPLEGEPEYARHVVKPFIIPDYWPHFIATDVGLSAMNYTLWGAVSPMNQVVIFKEYESESKKTKDWASIVGRYSFGREVKHWALDSTMFEGDGEKIIHTVKKHSGLRGVPIRKAMKGPGSRYLGLVMLEDYLRWDDTTDTPPKLHITTDCPLLIKTIPLCVYKEDKKKPGERVNDVAEFRGDDPYDAVRYLLNLCDGYIRGATTDPEANYIEAKIENLAKDNDWTSYFIHRQLQRAKKKRGRRRRYFSSRLSM